MNEVINNLNNLLKEVDEIKVIEDSDLYVCLHYILNNGYIEVAKQFIINMNFYNVKYLNPLLFNFIGNEDIINLLLPFNVDINGYNYCGGNFVDHMCFQWYNIQYIDNAVKLGWSINMTNKRGDTLLKAKICPIPYGSPRFKYIKYLLELGIDPNIKNNKGDDVFSMIEKKLCGVKGVGPLRLLLKKYDNRS